MTSLDINNFFPEQLKITDISETKEKIIIELVSQTKQGIHPFQTHSRKETSNRGVSFRCHFIFRKNTFYIDFSVYLMVQYIYKQRCFLLMRTHRFFYIRKRGLIMNTEYYRILLRAIEIGNITKAAEILGYTQSGISRIIGKLEEELGTSIVTRNRTGIELRDHAKPLIDTISQIVRLEDQLCQISDNIQKNSSNTIRIATFRTAAVEIIPQLIKGYCEVDPLVHFEITERGRFSYVEEELQSGRVDLAFTADFACADQGFLPLVRDYYYAVLPEGHPLCREKVVTAPMLSSYPFLISDAAEENENLRSYIALLRDQSDLVRMKMLDDSMTVSMVEKGLGIQNAMNAIGWDNKEAMDELMAKAVSLQPAAN